MADDMQNVINEIDSKAKSIDLRQISFVRTGFLHSAIARSTAVFNRNQELAEAWKTYANEETNPQLKARYNAIAQRYMREANAAQERVNNSNMKLQMANAQISLVRESIDKLLAAKEPTDVADALEKLINNLKALNYNTADLEELLNKLLASLEQQFTIILEYTVT